MLHTLLNCIKHICCDPHVSVTIIAWKFPRIYIYLCIHCICSVTATSKGCGSRGQGFFFFVLISFESLFPSTFYHPKACPTLSDRLLNVAPFTFRFSPLPSFPVDSYIEYYDTWLWKFVFQFFYRKLFAFFLGVTSVRFFSKVGFWINRQ